ncbi:MAG: V-type ATP synthase subunit E [Candidatus Scalindua sediminis]|nr:V-type ATP synthase subunit E [Candidatus Scalindua sediminis]
MSLKRIKNSILTDAKKEAERIVEDAKERLQEKVRDEKSKIEEGLKEKYTRLGKKLEEDKKRELIEQRTNYRMGLLGIKNNIIEEIFKKAEEKFISDEQYWRSMEKWLKDINDAGQILVNTRDSKRFNSEFINKNSKKDNLVLDKKNIDIKGGFILRTARFEIDHTLDTILSNLRIELAPLIARELFSE